MSDEEQRPSRITYGGQEFVVPAAEGQKVIDAMSSQASSRVHVQVTPDQSLWLTLGPGIAVSVLEDRRGVRVDNAVYF